MSLVTTLCELAAGGRAVVTTIHQPSSRLYQQLDKLLLLSDGHCMFYGGQRKWRKPDAYSHGACGLIYLKSASGADSCGCCCRASRARSTVVPFAGVHHALWREHLGPHS